MRSDFYYYLQEYKMKYQLVLAFTRITIVLLLFRKLSYTRERIEEVWLDQIKWVYLTESNNLRAQLIKNNSNILISNILMLSWQVTADIGIK